MVDLRDTSPPLPSLNPSLKPQFPKKAAKCKACTTSFSPFLNPVHHNEVSLVPFRYARQWHLVAKLFPDKAVAAGTETNAFGGIGDTKH